MVKKELAPLQCLIALNKQDTKAPFPKGLSTLLLFLLLLLGLGAKLVAQTHFEASGPKRIALDEQFQVKFTLSNAEGSDFSAPAFEGFNVLFNPEGAVSYININGKQSTTYTGTFMAQRVGKVTIGSASIMVKGKQYQTKPFTIEVLPAEGKRGGNSRPAGLAENDIFILVTSSKETVYEQEATLLTFKLYTRTARMDFQKVKFPEYDGFIEQELEVDNAGQLQMEHYNGRNYYTAVLRRSLIFPQRSGKLTVPQGVFTISIAIETTIGDGESFFGITAMPMVEKTITSPAVNINVKPLPTPKPASFKNAVGQFDISVELPDKEALRTGEIALLNATISGQGNLKLLAGPTVSFPETFETYEPKSQTNITPTPNGVTGEKRFEYNIVPRNIGTFTLPPIEFTYFDPESQKYVTKRTDAMRIDVKKGNGSGASQTDVELLDNDIAYLKDFSSRTSGTLLQSKALGILLIPYGIVILLAVCFALFYVHYKQQKRDIAGTRRRIAAKRIRRHFQAIQSEASQGNFEGLYARLPNLIYAYLADKFTLPTHALNRVNIRKTLEEEAVKEEIIERLMVVLEQVEAAAFATQSERNEPPHKLLNDTMAVIHEIELTTKKR